MRKGDAAWGGLMAVFILLLIIPTTRETFITITDQHKLIGGFIKFAVLASMGSLLAKRLRTGAYNFGTYFLMRAVSWGMIGIWITITFAIYDIGINYLTGVGFLRGEGNALVTALHISILTNLSFAPAFMVFHNISDAYLDLKGAKEKHITWNMIAEKIDWNGFVSFTLAKTLPRFWIPAHTITFLLPSEYRVLFAAMLSIVLGVLLNIANGRKSQSNI